jgi:sulfate transport system ATP-binding protein
MSVEVVDLTKRFSRAGMPAVSGATFHAPPGAITSLIGPSGAGKSTVLRLIAGLEVPDGGRVLIDDLDCASVPVQKRGVGFVFQNYALFNHMTVRDNVAFGLSVRKVPRRDVDQRVAELLELVQLGGYAHRYARQLSGGQRQRVAFARSLAVHPRVLLLDEPFGALDAQVRTELRDWLQKLHEKTRITTVLVTHDQSEALEVSEHVVVMLEGKVMQAGPPNDVYEQPAGPTVAAFLGGATVLQGRVRAGQAELGSLHVPAPKVMCDGQAVQAFVRSHDVTLTRTDGGNGSSALSTGRITRVKVVGGRVKLLLMLPNGDSVAVEMDAAEFESLGVDEGAHVYVNVRRAQVFVSDYSI